MGSDEALDKFVAEMLEDKDLSGVNDDAKKYLIEDLKNRLMDQINRALINELSDDKLTEFNSMLDSESTTEEQVQQFVVNSGVDVNKVVAKTALAFRELYLQSPTKQENSNQ
jgi:hypothetical protein